MEKFYEATPSRSWRSCTIYHHHWACDPVGALTIDDLKKKKEHNQAMLEIAYALTYVDFDDINGCENEKKMWDSLHTI